MRDAEGEKEELMLRQYTSSIVKVTKELIFFPWGLIYMNIT